ncbi:MAG: dienelactone hydrolase family protein [Holosporaceae bacterium]|jgi:phospholipase/carboxylesterase|nr:dienelactone hydrolase family protein [Holosporaceae bacterium]
MDEIVLAARSEVKKIVFLFHGYGANKDDLLPIGERISAVFPESEVRIPDGIEKCGEGRRQWFGLEGDDVRLWKRAFEKNCAQITSYVDSVIGEKKLTNKDVIFSGFSQGAMLSLSLGLKYNAAATIAFSGLLLDPEVCADNCDTKILLTHGEKDNVIPITALKLTEDALKRCCAHVETAISPDLAHGIDDYLLNQAIDFLRRL